MLTITSLSRRYGLLFFVIASGCTSLGGQKSIESGSSSNDLEIASVEIPRGEPPPIADKSSVEPSPPKLDKPGACLSNRQKVAQLVAVLLTPKEIELVRHFAANGELGFVGLVGKHDKRIGQSLKKLQEVAQYPVLIASDEEAQNVQRLGNAIGPLPSIGDLLKMPRDQIRRAYAEYGRKMVDLGITINFAPVLDVGFGPGIGTRALGSNPDIVTDYATAITKGLTDAGVMPVYKHFPGHGSASDDSHDTLPTTPHFSTMQDDLAPYRALLNPEPDPDSSAGVMVGHLLVPGLSDNIPTSLSPRTINELLRTELGFDGLVFTDALNMGAITDTYTTLDAAIAAINAGADVVMVAGHATLEPLLDALEIALLDGRLNSNQVDQSLIRILSLKAISCSVDDKPEPTL